MSRKFYIVCGHYGCGKSNYSINHALKLAKEGRKVILMDLDLVQNFVEDLSPLAEIKSLKRLWIYRNIKTDLESPDDETVRMLQEALPNCYIAARDTSRSKAWVNHPHQEAIQRMFHYRVYEPFEDSLPENMPEPWRSEALAKAEEEQASEEVPEETSDAGQE